MHVTCVMRQFRLTTGASLSRDSHSPRELFEMAMPGLSVDPKPPEEEVSSALALTVPKTTANQQILEQPIVPGMPVDARLRLVVSNLLRREVLKDPSTATGEGPNEFPISSVSWTKTNPILQKGFIGTLEFTLKRQMNLQK